MDLEIHYFELILFLSNINRHRYGKGEHTVELRFV